MQKSQIFHPSVWECQKAREVFMQAFQNRSIDNSLEIAIRCALDAVWEAARRHQVQLEAEEQEYQRKLNDHKNNTKDIVEVAV